MTRKERPNVLPLEGEIDLHVSPEVAESLHRQIGTAIGCAEEIEKRRKLGKPYCVITGYRDPLDQVVEHAEL